MCTAATYCNGDFYFGRNLDYEFSYGEHVTITPRNYPIRLHGGALDRHYAMIGMAHIQNDYPLYYDAVNEKGLCIAGLNFVGNAVYPPVTQGVASVPQYALIRGCSARAPRSPRHTMRSRAWLWTTHRLRPSCRARSCTGWLPTAAAASWSRPRRTACTSMTTRSGC